jgi:hypothetical protein
MQKITSPFQKRIISIPHEKASRPLEKSGGTKILKILRKPPKLLIT